jgi:hypothetical protein
MFAGAKVDLKLLRLPFGELEDNVWMLADATTTIL